MVHTFKNCQAGVTYVYSNDQHQWHCSYASARLNSMSSLVTTISGSGSWPSSTWRTRTRERPRRWPRATPALSLLIAGTYHLGRLYLLLLFTLLLSLLDLKSLQISSCCFVEAGDVLVEPELRLLVYIDYSCKRNPSGKYIRSGALCCSGIAPDAAYCNCNNSYQFPTRNTVSSTFTRQFIQLFYSRSEQCHIGSISIGPALATTAASSSAVWVTLTGDLQLSVGEQSSMC